MSIPKSLHNQNQTTYQYLTSFLHQFLTNPISNIKHLIHSHTLIITTGNSNNLFISSKLISLYSSFNQPTLSTLVFNSTNPKDTFLWNSIIKSHFSNGHYSNTLHFYLQMRASNFLPNPFTIPMLVSASAELSDVKTGQSAHSLASKVGLFASNSAVGSSFIYLYAKLGQMKDACKVFDEMTVRDVVAWTALVVGYVHNDENEKGLTLLCKMHKIGEDGQNPNYRTIACGLHGCGNMGGVSSGRCLHGYSLKTGIGCSVSVRSSLLSMYSKCNKVDEAYLAFRELPRKDIVSWTSIVGVYARNGSIFECLKLFTEMLASEMVPDEIIVSCMLLGFGNAGNAYYGKAFHGIIIRRNFEVDHTVSCSLLSMYCKLGGLDIAERLFNRLCEFNAESWNIMVSGYGMMGLAAKCIELFRVMQDVGVESDMSTLALVISSCSRLVTPHLGRSIHCYVLKSRFYANISITNSLVGMYGKFWNLTPANRVFQMANKDVVTWNTLISAYTHNGHLNEALAVFDQMVLANMEPNSVTLVTVLSACSQLAALDHGKRVHMRIKEIGLESDVTVATALVDMYVKCGQLHISRDIFDMVLERDVVLWNVMISGYGMHGDAISAMEVFQQLEESGLKPNGLSFLAVLSACTHAGLVEQGKYLFGRMEEYRLMPTLKHYACMVDLLGRSGNLHDAKVMIESMPMDPDGGMWGTLLSACRIHNDVEMGCQVAERAIASDPENDGYYIILSNMYSYLGKWNEAQKVRQIMKNKGVRKQTGWSAI